MRFTDIEITGDGFKGQDEEMLFSADWPLFIIGEAWALNVNFEDLADGFGPGEGTHGDWSAIRDSSKGARTRMLERSMNHLFGAKCNCGFAYMGDGHHAGGCRSTGGQS